ncbi:MAG: hypothetical protein KBF84_07415 [Candidatus Microthrix sp.]|nr:hypothetical protein [Candidatus Microthrix sp.]
MLNDDNIDNCRTGVPRIKPIFAEPNPDREPYTDFFSTLLVGHLLGGLVEVNDEVTSSGRRHTVTGSIVAIADEQEGLIAPLPAPPALEVTGFARPNYVT